MTDDITKRCRRWRLPNGVLRVAVFYRCHLLNCRVSSIKRFRFCFFEWGSVMRFSFVMTGGITKRCRSLRLPNCVPRVEVFYRRHLLICRVSSIKRFRFCFLSGAQWCVSIWVWQATLLSATECGDCQIVFLVWRPFTDAIYWSVVLFRWSGFGSVFWVGLSDAFLFRYDRRPY